jgi:hypothetical protein
MPTEPEVIQRMRAAATMAPGSFVQQHILSGETYAFRTRPMEYQMFLGEVASSRLPNYV